MSGEGFILDTPDQIRAFALLQVYYKLKMEVENPKGPKWRGNPKNQAVSIMEQAGIEVENPRMRRSVFVQYAAYLASIGVRKECDGHGQ